MKVLIIALDGQIRDALQAQFEVRKRSYEAVGKEWLNTDGPIDVQQPPLTIPADIGVVVNALSLECLEQQAGENLIDSLALLAQACEQASIPLIELSNSQVFDGFDGGRNREADDVVPASRVGGVLSRHDSKSDPKPIPN